MLPAKQLMSLFLLIIIIYGFLVSRVKNKQKRNHKGFILVLDIHGVAGKDNEIQKDSRYKENTKLSGYKLIFQCFL